MTQTSATRKRLLTTGEVCRLLDLKGNRKLVKALVRIHNIPHYSFGGGPQPAMVIDQAALEVLRVKVKEWQARPRIAAMLRDRETAATT